MLKDTKDGDLKKGEQGCSTWNIFDGLGFFPRINSWGGAVGLPPTDKSMGWRGCVFEGKGVYLGDVYSDMPSC